jgi:type I restriction enzyme S subunit
VNFYDTVPVSEIAQILIGGTPSRSKPEFWNGVIKWASAKDVATNDSRYLTNTEETITELGVQKSAAKVLDEGTIVITARGTVGAMAILGEKMAFNQTCYGLIANENVDPLFFYYALKASLGQLAALSYGTVFDTITMKTFNSLAIPLSPLPTQRRIAEILGRLDDKIEVNRRINRILEVMAQALFKYWFVDFGPFQEGEFVESELGLIPKGWRVGTVENIIDLAYGKGLPEKQRNPGKYPVFGSSGQVGIHDQYLIESPGIIVGRKGTIGSLSWARQNFWPIDTTFYVIPKRQTFSL